MLQLGDMLPSFALPDQHGEEINSETLFGKPCVIFFYPKYDTPVCTIEACTFQSELSAFNQFAATVIGISTDSPASHLNFANKHGLSFKLLSDVDKHVEKLFGLKRSFFGVLAQRATFVFDENGVLLKVIDSRFDGKKHMSEALIQLKELHH